MPALRLIPGILAILLLAIAPAAAQVAPEGPEEPTQLSAETGNNPPPTERAVPKAQRWLYQHQISDGSWRFDPPAGDEKAYANPGIWRSPTAATALALWPFLASGQTHKTKGPNRETISAGLLWLVKHQSPNGNLSTGGTKAMLSHALGTMVLCEVYEMTEDRKIGAAAVQQAINFLIVAQDKKTGGWAQQSDYSPTLSLTTAAIMALRRAKMAGLNVPQSTLEAAAGFVKKMKSRDGLQYGETRPTNVSLAATAFGLLSQTYLDDLSANLKDRVPSPKEKDDKAGDRGAEYLVKTGPFKNDCFYNLCATMFLHARGGYEWDDWNRKMRRQLILSQVGEGNEKGTWWNSKDIRAAEGGRLFQTVINVMILEVYNHSFGPYKIDAETAP